ncbi:MAG: UDP-N-acetylenolpyruvoylglucosamine reductase, partial [Candidatus Omnitrophica bacterium]|nr:UDP-N-acetylenolpyruvoylglucosamine reductase [Candidatus Omnitrophota bacterium]
GSFFKNPRDDYAGKLIETCGCKGMCIGDARVSDVHANWIVNGGNASSRDIVQLMNDVQRKVFETCAVRLEPEVRLLGRGCERLYEL